MTTTIVTRTSKGSPLTFNDMDNNLINLRVTADNAYLNTLTLTDTTISLQQQITTNLTLVDASLADMSAQVTSFGLALTTNTTNTQSILTQVSSFSSQLTSINSSISGLYVDVTQLQTSLVGLNTTINSLPSLTYVNTHLAGSVINTVNRIDQTVPVYDASTGTYLHLTYYDNSVSSDSILALQNSMVAATANITTLQTLTTDTANTLTDLQVSLGTIPDSTYVDTHLAGKVINTSTRVDNSIPVYSISTGSYSHETIENIQSSLVTTINILTSDFVSVANDVLELKTTVSSLPTVSSVNSQIIAYSEPINTISGIAVDLTLKADNSFLVYDEASDTFIFETLDNSHSSLLSDISDLQTSISTLNLSLTSNEATLTTLTGDFSSLVTTVSTLPEKDYVDTHLFSIPLLASSSLTNFSVPVYSSTGGYYHHIAIEDILSGVTNSILENTTNIATNTTNIATNTTNITNNAANIAANVEAISNLQYDISELQTTSKEYYSITEQVTNKIYNDNQVYRVCWFNQPITDLALSIPHGLSDISKISYFSGKFSILSADGLTINRVLPLPYSDSTNPISFCVDTTNIYTSESLLSYLTTGETGLVDVIIEYTK